MLLWQRRPCRPQPGQRSELWSRSLWPSWRSAESGSSPALRGPPAVMGQTQSDKDSLVPCLCIWEKQTNKQATQTSNSWLAILKWDDFTMSQTSRLFTIVPEIMKEKCVWVFQRCNYSIHLITTAHASHCMMLSLPLTFTLPRWRMAASSLEISQESLSVNMRIFRAERKWAYSFTSSRPSQLVHLPWWQDHMV